MLKIKDDVDLKELKRFGFKPKYNEDTGKLIEMYRIRGNRKGATIKFKENFDGRRYKNFWHVYAWNKQIIDHGYIKLTDEDYEVLFDLIKADLVEKV